MPELHHRQAKWAPRESASRHRLLSHGLAWLRGSCAEMPLEGVPECCSGARARRERQRHWYGRRGAFSPSLVGTPSQRAPIPCSYTTSRDCVEVPLEGAPECCPGARARRERPLVRATWGTPRSVSCYTSALRASVPPSLAPTRPPVAACRSVAQALEDEGKGSGTGTDDVGNMPKPHHRQAS